MDSLLLLPNFVSGSRLKLMYISLIINIRSSLIYMHFFQLLFLLLCLIEITSLVRTNKTNFLCLRPSLDSLVIAAKVLEAAKLGYNSSITSQKLGSRDV